MKKGKKQLVNKTILWGLGILILGSILYYVYGDISQVIIFLGIIVMLLGYNQLEEKSEKQKGNKNIIYGLGILILGSFIADNTLYDSESSIISLVGVAFIFWGFVLRGAFNNLGEQIETTRKLWGECPKCGKKIGHSARKCPYCTADF